MTRHVAFLRGINLGKRQVKSADLVDAFAAMGFDNVKTLLASGNVLFDADKADQKTIETTLEDWQKVFQVNFFAPVMLARGLADELRQAQGAVVNVSSIAGSRVHPYAGSAYATSKAALAALTREMAADFGPLGIRVNAIAPGEIDTSILSPGTEKLVEQFPLRRLGRPEEVASVIYFLCNEPSSYVTGAEIHVNGGQHV